MEAGVRTERGKVGTRTALISVIRMEAATGFEPVDDGFANRCLSPLGYAARCNMVVLNHRITVVDKTPSVKKMGTCRLLVLALSTAGESHHMGHLRIDLLVGL